MPYEFLSWLSSMTGGDCERVSLESYYFLQETFTHVKDTKSIPNATARH